MYKYFKFFESNHVILFLICFLSITSMRNTMFTIPFLVPFTCVFFSFSKKAQYPSHIGRRWGQQDIYNVHSQHKIISASAQSRAHYMSLFWVGWTVWKKKRKTNPFNISSYSIKQRVFFLFFYQTSKLIIMTLLIILWSLP